MKKKLLHLTIVLCVLFSQFVYSQQKLDCDLNYRKALFHLTGDGNFEKDSIKSIALLAPCIKLGHANSQLLMGRLYMAKKEHSYYKKAFDLFKKAAKQGNSLAATDLGILYKYGLGTSLSYNNARKWFKKGAELGDSKAMYSLGYLYLKGFGNISQDYKKAIHWFEKSEYPMAKYWLGYCYYYGFGVPKNQEKAKELMGSNFTSESVEKSLLSLSNKSEITTYKKLQKLQSETYKTSIISDNHFFGKWSGSIFQLDWSGKHIIQKTPIKINFYKDSISQKPFYKITTGKTETIGELNKVENTLYFENLNLPLDHVILNKNLPDTLNYQISSTDLSIQELDGQIYLIGNLKNYIQSWGESGAPINIVLKKKKTFLNSTEELSEEAEQSLLLQKDSFIKLYPNPFQKDLIISYTLENEDAVSITISDIKGRKTTVIQQEKIQQEGTYQYYFNGSSLEKGMYIIRIQTNKTTKTRIIVKK